MTPLAHRNQILRFGVYQVHLGSGQLRRNGSVVKLQEQPFQILCILLEHPGELVTRETLRHQLWADDTFVDFNRSLNTALTKLRRALSDSAENPRFIETVPRHGYRFIAPVARQENSEDATQPLEVASPAVPADLAVPTLLAMELEGRSPDSNLGIWPQLLRFRPVYVLAIVLIVTACLGAVYFKRVYHPPLPSLPPVAVRHSVVVLGFENLTGDAEHAWLSTALSDWLSAELAAGDQLRMIPAEDVARMKVELKLPVVNSLGQATLQRIRQNLGTDWVVIGSYASLRSASGADVRVDIRLQDTRTGETLATLSEAGSEAHLFDLISHVGDHLRAKLDIRPVTPQQQAEVAVTLPSDRDAARFYAEGLTKLRNYDALAARNLLLKAIAIEPNDALPHSALASAWLKLGHDADAIAEAKKASKLSSSLPPAEQSLVLARQFEVSNRWEQAIATYKPMFDTYPDRTDYGLALVHVQVRGGKGKDAEETVRALRKTTLSLADDACLDLAEAEAADAQGNLKRALDSADKGAEKARSIGSSVLLAGALTMRANELRGLGRLDEAANAVRESESIFAALGDKAGLAGAQAIGAHLLDLQGDFVGANKTYESSLSTFRSIGDREGVARELNNIAVERNQLGDLHGARKNFQDALTAWSELQDHRNVALSQSNVGNILLDLGDLRGAEKMYKQSLIICQMTGNSDLAAHDLEGLGLVLRAQGRLSEARQDETKAVEVFQNGGQTQIVEAYMNLAEVLLDLGWTEDASVAARKALEQTEKFGSPNGSRVDAEVVLAQVLVVQGRILDSKKILDTATATIGQQTSKEREFVFYTVAARVRLASPNQLERMEATKSLRSIVAKTQQTGFVQEEFEARLRLAEAEIGAGDLSGGHAHLAALEKAAVAKGFALISQKAHALLYAQPDEVNAVRKPSPEA